MTATAVRLSADDLRAAQLRGVIEYERCRRSPLYWAERYAFTRVEDDKIGQPFRPLIGGTLAVNPQDLSVRKLTDGPDEYLRYLVLAWEAEQLLAIPKSRQQRISWFAVAMQLWLAQFRTAQRVAIQSKKESDADLLLQRAVVILELQRTVAPVIPWPQYRYRFCSLRIQHGRLMGASIVQAIAQGAEKVRGEAYSSIFSDETAFQGEAEAAHAAMMPLMERGCRMLYVSSAAASTFFQRLVDDAI
jgi:hypothetical protein